ncbi:MAG: rhomboid family intramembrane serine protease [Acidobacteriota bacterium]|nr:MAG: rhomboid family intramembrane serine protease [Acidobacteriota bacterium]
MIIPIEHENMTVRRLPWVTIGIMALCGLLFVPTWLLRSGPEQEIEDRLEQVLQFYFEHPYLELHPGLAEVVLGGAREQEQQALLEVLKQQVERRPSDAERAEQQIELDRLSEDALAAIDDHPLRRWGLTPSRAQAETFVSHMFLHAGWLHLLGNMLILYLAGPFLEDRFSRPLFAGLYAVGGLVAAASHVMMFPRSDIPLVGASGAIAGLMGAFLIRSWQTKIRFLYILGIWARGTFWAPAWVMLPLWLLTQVFMGTMTHSLGGEDGAGVAYWAHVGGFVLGVAAAFAIKKLEIEERYVRPVIDAKTQQIVIDNPVIEQAMAAHAAGRSAEAVTALRESLAERPDDRDAAIAIWELACQLERAEQGAPYLLRVIDAETRAGEIDLAIAHWNELTEHVPDPTADAALLVRLAQAMLKDRSGADAKKVLARAFATPSRTASLTLRIAHLARPLDTRLARQAAETALAMPDLQPAEKDHAQTLLTELSRETALSG